MISFFLSFPDLLSLLILNIPHVPLFHMSLSFILLLQQFVPSRRRRRSVPFFHINYPVNKCQMYTSAPSTSPDPVTDCHLRLRLLLRLHLLFTTIIITITSIMCHNFVELNINNKGTLQPKNSTKFSALILLYSHRSPPHLPTSKGNSFGYVNIRLHIKHILLSSPCPLTDDVNGRTVFFATLTHLTSLLFLLLLMLIIRETSKVTLLANVDLFLFLRTFS